MVHTEELGTWLQKCKNAKKKKSTHNTHWYLVGKADITVCFGATGNLMGCPKWERFILWGAWTNSVHFMGICSLDRLIVEHLAVRYEGWLIGFGPVGGRRWVIHLSLHACAENLKLITFVLHLLKIASQLWLRKLTTLTCLPPTRSTRTWWQHWGRVAPSDCYLFPTIKKKLSGHHFDSDYDIIAAVDHSLEVQDTNFYKERVLYAPWLPE